MFANCAHLVPSRIIPGGISSALVWLRLRRAVPSVLKILACGFDCRREEAVGPVGRQECPEKSIRVNETFDRHAVSQYPLECASRGDNTKFTMCASKHLVYDKFVFFRLQ